MSNSAIFGIQAKTFDQIISKAQRGALNEDVRELGYGQDREPTERKGIEKLQGRSKEAYVGTVEEQGLPHIDAVREHAYMRYWARVEEAAYSRGRVSDAP
jgi:hypothetical protein